jgi:vitamin B12 transporter
MRTRLLLLAAGLVGGTTPVLAADPPPLQVEETLVVTASADPEPIRTLSTAVDVIDAAEIEARQASEILDLLATVPGLTVLQSGSPGKAASVFTRGTNSNHTLFLWNGIELNDPVLGGFDSAFLPTDGVERIEVVRGPYSALWGSQAIGGVIQVLTRSESGTTLRLEAGDAGYARAGLAAGWRFGDGLGLDLVGHLRQGDGEVENDFYDGGELAARLGWRPRDSVSVGLVARGGESTIGVPFDFFGTPSPRREQARQSAELALPVEVQAGPWALSGRLLRATTDLQFRDPDDPFAKSRGETERTGARAVATHHFDEGLWAAVGGDWEEERATSVDAFGPGLGDDRAETWSAFGAVHRSTDRWSVELGVRRDEHDAFGGETSAKLGAALRWGAVRLRGSWGEGFRAPSLGDLYFPGFGNPDLQPERSRSAEVGLDFDRGPFAVAASLFDNEQEDLIVFDFVRGIPLNVGRARSRGVEAEVRFTRPRWSVRANGTFQDAENRDTGSGLLRRPERAGNLVATFRPADDWTAFGVLRHVGARPDFGADLPAFTTLTLGAAWRASERLEPFARLENALDREYEEVAGFPSPGRRFVGGLAVRF